MGRLGRLVDLGLKAVLFLGGGGGALGSCKRYTMLRKSPLYSGKRLGVPGFSMLGFCLRRRGLGLRVYLNPSALNGTFRGSPSSWLSFWSPVILGPREFHRGGGGTYPKVSEYSPLSPLLPKAP